MAVEYGVDVPALPVNGKMEHALGRRFPDAFGINNTLIEITTLNLYKMLIRKRLLEYRTGSADDKGDLPVCNPEAQISRGSVFVKGCQVQTVEFKAPSSQLFDLRQGRDFPRDEFSPEFCCMKRMAHR
jgi:hypothetical protein